MVFDQIGGSFELAEPIGQIFFFHVFGYLPKIKHSAFYCILMVWPKIFFRYGYCQAQSRLSGQVTHPSWMGQVTKIMTREVVYYILSGTLRGTQKCLWSNLRVEFSGDIHPWSGQFSRGLYRPRIELQMVAMDSWRNSDVFKKKKFQNPPIISWVIDGPP